MKKIALLVTVLTFSIGFCVLAHADVKDNIDESQMKITWQDEFYGNSLSSWWAPQRGNGSTYGVWEWGNNEKEFYKDANISVSNGNLVLNAKYEPNAGKVNDTVYNFSSGRVWSSGRVDLGNGYTEARIKVPSAKGIWPAFWMLGTNGKTWPGCGEIDIMESFNTRTDMQATIHYPTSTNTDLYNFYKKTLTNKTNWHTYGVYRDGKNIAFYIDRELYGLATTADGYVGAWSAKDGYKWVDSIWGKRSVLNDNHYLLLNIACGGNLAQGMPDTDLNVNMYVDYVRHYVDDPKPTTKAPTKPGKAKIKSLKNKKKRKLIVAIKKIKSVAGYQVKWCDNKKYDGYEIKTVKKPKLTIKGLDKKSTYWVRARAFRKNGSSKLFGKWSASKKKKIKK